MFGKKDKTFKPPIRRPHKTKTKNGKERKGKGRKGKERIEKKRKISLENNNDNNPHPVPPLSVVNIKMVLSQMPLFLKPPITSVSWSSRADIMPASACLGLF